MKSKESISVIKTRSGKLISYEEDRDILVVEHQSGGSRIVIDLSSDKVTIQADGDIELASNRKIKLAAKEGIEIQTDGEARLEAKGETIVKGSMVRIN